MSGDIFGAFAKAVLAARPRSLYLVSPWVNESARGLAALVDHARRADARVVLVSRAPTSPPHEAVVKLVRALPRGEVSINQRLHAKVYLCETTWGTYVAVVGSANLTRSSTGMLEVGVMLLSTGRDRVLRDLVARVNAIARGGRSLGMTRDGGRRQRRTS